LRDAASSAVRCSTPVTARRAPLKGEHTEEVLRGLAGYMPEEIEQLREKNVI